MAIRVDCSNSSQADARRHYLAARLGREEEFLQYVRSGQIEITADYLHFDERRIYFRPSSFILPANTHHIHT